MRLLTGLPLTGPPPTSTIACQHDHLLNRSPAKMTTHQNDHLPNQPLNTMTFVTMSNFRRHVRLAIALFLIGATTLPAAAQPTWTEGTAGGPQVSLDWAKPSFEGGGELVGEIGTSFPTSRLIFSGQYPIGDAPGENGIRLVADLPISHFSIDDEDAGEADGISGTEVGNPYLGAHARLTGEWAIGGGVRLPLASMPDLDFGASEEEQRQSLVDALALRTGSIVDISRVEAFGPETFTTRGYGAYTLQSPSGLSARLRSGLTLLVPTENTDRRENVVLLDYGGRAWYDGEQFRVGVGVGGRTNLNADEEESFEERTLTFLDAAAQFRFGRVRPGLTFRVPLSEEPSEVLGYAVGIDVTVTF
jgi:hypothetical protein